MPVAEVKKPVANSSVGGRRRDEHRIGGSLTGADDPPGLGWADPKHRCGGPLGGDVEDDRRWNQGRVALEVMRGKTIWRT